MSLKKGMVIYQVWDDADPAETDMFFAFSESAEAYAKDCERPQIVRRVLEKDSKQFLCAALSSWPNR